MHPLVYCVGVFVNFLRFLFRPFFWFKSKGTRKKLPKISNEILKLSAKKLSFCIRSRKFTCLQVVTAYIDRIQEVNPIVNAVVEDRFKEATEEAKSFDGFLRATDLSSREIKREYPLLGVPFTVKESVGVKGMKKTYGSLLRLNAKCQTDGDPVYFLKKAGGVPLLISNTPEFCISWETSNLVTGKTNNPYDTRRTCGGSSGGEGALLGCGASVVGLGSDMGGSVRIPAAFNGVFGHKPTAGMISSRNITSVFSDDKVEGMFTVGPMTRYAEDLELLMKILIKDERVLLGLKEEVDMRKLKVYYMEENFQSLGRIAVQQEIKESILNVCDYLKGNFGCVVKKKKFGLLDESVLLNGKMYEGGDGNIQLGHYDTQKKDHDVVEEFLDALKRGLLSGPFIAFTVFYQLYNLIFKRHQRRFNSLIEELRSEMTTTLGNDGVFICPTTPTSALYHGEYILTPYYPEMVCIFNVLNFPATNVPMGLDKEGLPIGIQVVAASMQDRLCLAVAKELEKKFGGWTPPS